MAAKKWSRQEEEKKLKDHMAAIQVASSDLAMLSKKRQDALQQAVPGIHRQQENAVLQNAADWHKFYEDDTAWLQQKARLEAEQLIDTNEALPKMRREYATLRTQLDALKLVKRDPDIENSQWTAIHDLRNIMLEHPKMVQAFFGDGFVGKLEETFETKWSSLSERIEQLKGSVFRAVYEARDEVKDFLETDFNPRLGRTVQVLRDAHTEALEQIEDLDSRCEDFTVRLEQRKEELTKLQGAHAETEETLKGREEEFANLQGMHEETLEAAERLKKELATTNETVKRREKDLANLQYSYDVMAENLDSSEKSVDRIKDAHQRQIATKEHSYEAERMEAAQEKEEVQSQLNALQLKFDKLQTSSTRAQEKHEADKAAKEQDYAAERQEAARQKDEMQSKLDALQLSFDNLQTSANRAQQEHEADVAAKERAHEAERQEAARQKDEVQSHLDTLQHDFDNLDGRFKQSESNRQEDRITIQTLEASLAEDKNKFGDFEDQAAQDSNKIASLEANLDEEKKKLEKATLQHREMDAQYSVLASLDLTKTSAISSRPVQELTAIVTRAAGFAQSTANVEAARILDSNNTDLPEGTQLIADVSPNIFILIAAPGKVQIFDKADIQRVEYDYSFNKRLVIDGKSLLVCSTPDNVENNEVWESWMNRYFEGVVYTAVEEE